MLIRKSKRNRRMEKRNTVKAESLGSLAHYLAVEGYSAEDLTTPIGAPKKLNRVEESVERAEAKMRPIIARAFRTR